MARGPLISEGKTSPYTTNTQSIVFTLDRIEPIDVEGYTLPQTIPKDGSHLSIINLPNGKAKETYVPLKFHDIHGDSFLINVFDPYHGNYQTTIQFEKNGQAVDAVVGSEILIGGDGPQMFKGVDLQDNIFAGGGNDKIIVNSANFDRIDEQGTLF